MNFKGVLNATCTIFVAAALFLGCLVPPARGDRPVPTDETLAENADVVVIATSSKDEDVKLDNPKPGTWVGVNTVFKRWAVIKGKLSDETFTFRHNRFFDPKFVPTDEDGPVFVEFDSTGHTQYQSGHTEYLLFLKKHNDGRYEAVSGSTDEYLSVKVVMPYYPQPHVK